MSANGWLQFVAYSAVLLLLVKPVGVYLARVLEGERTWLDPVLRPIESLTYRLCGVHAEREMNWHEYAFAMLGFSLVTMMLTYITERTQALLPWNPQHLATSRLTSRGTLRQASLPIQTGSSTPARPR